MPLNDKERKIISYCEQQWFLQGVLPTPETLCDKFNITHRAIKQFLDNEEVQQSFDARGIPTISGRDLTPEMITALNTMLNVYDRRSERKKLADMGLTERKWDSWRRDPKVQEYMATRTEQILSGALPDAHLALVERVRNGDLGALKFYYEMTGRYTGQGSNLDIRDLLNRVFEVISLHVKDPATLTALAGGILGLAGIDPPATMNSEMDISQIPVAEVLPQDQLGPGSL